MLVRLGVFACLVSVLALAGCGGATEEGAAIGASADVVPADVALYLSIGTDVDGEEWQKAEALIDRFPDGEWANQFLELPGKEALGPETAVVMLDATSDGPRFLGLTQPSDRQKLEELLARGDTPLVTDDVAGWTVFAEEQATIDRFEEARGGGAGALADSKEYAAALDGLEEGLARVYVSNEALEEAAARHRNEKTELFEALLPEGEFPTVGLTIGAEDDGGRLDGKLVFEGDLEEAGVPVPYEAKLPAQVPDEVLAYLSFNDFERGFSHVRDALGQIDPALGRLSDDDLAPLFAGEGALYVRGGALIPEVTLVTQVDDEEGAVRTLDEVVEGFRRSEPTLSSPERTEIAGVEARRVAVEEPFSLYYAAFDGKLVVTTAREGIADLREDGGRFADQESFAEAKEQAEMPGETSGFAYVELEEIVPLLLGYMGISGGEMPIPPEAAANLEPLQSLVAYATSEGETIRFSAFLAVK
jgi:Protein of unknown function (DUF3352)